MSRRYDSRVSFPQKLRRGSCFSVLFWGCFLGCFFFFLVWSLWPATDVESIYVDHYLLAGGPPLPGRVCPGSHLTRRHRDRNPRQGRHRAGRGAQGHVQVIRAGHVSGEALHSERVRGRTNLCSIFSSPPSRSPPTRTSHIRSFRFLKKKFRREGEENQLN